MKETYIIRLPNRAGVFLSVCEIVALRGGSIQRINYNNGIDMNTVFLEVEGSEEVLGCIRKELDENHYLAKRDGDLQAILVQMRIPDGIGAVMPVLRVISRHHVNISFVDYQHSDEENQIVRMGLHIDRGEVVQQLLSELGRVCETQVLNYEVTDRSMDGSVFYVTFANEIRDILKLEDKQTEQILIQSNRIMQMLDEDNRAYLKTFDYIRRFALFIRDHSGKNFHARITRMTPAEGLVLTSIEPPCGSSIYILEFESRLLFVDCGFACYREEMLDVIHDLYPDFEKRSREIVITHADIDHTGLLDLFDRVYLSQSCYDNFTNERNHVPNYREQNILHQPYCIISKIITGYCPPPPEHMEIIGKRTSRKLLSRIGQFSFGKWTWQADEGMGGHVRGETVISCPELGVVFSGDIFVNIKQLTEDQREFNLLAPYLMTSVEEDSGLAKQTRNLFMETFRGYLICPGHGPVLDQQARKEENKKMDQKMLLCPSVFNLPSDNMREEVEKLDASDMDIYHVDFMDGTFVPNFALSFRELEMIRRVTDAGAHHLIDCHMMVVNPHRYIGRVAEAGADIIYIHPESESVPSATLELIQMEGKKTGLVLNPCTTLESVKDMLPITDYLMIMGVNPGFAGRDFMPYTREKFIEADRYRKEKGLHYHILLDGGSTREVISDLYHNCGTEGYVLGKQELFFQKDDYGTCIKRIRAL